jgi:hypothetical protein
VADHLRRAAEQYVSACEVQHTHDGLASFRDARSKWDTIELSFARHQETKEHIPTADEDIEIMDGEPSLVFGRQQLDDVHVVETATGLNKKGRALDRGNGFNKLFDFIELLTRKPVEPIGNRLGFGGGPRGIVHQSLLLRFSNANGLILDF